MGVVLPINSWWFVVFGAVVCSAVEKPCRITCGENEAGDVTAHHGLLSSVFLGAAHALSMWHEPLAHRCFLDEDGVCVCVCEVKDGHSSASASVPENIEQPFFNPVRAIYRAIATAVFTDASFFNRTSM
jgi:hypothetical protein